MGRGISVIWEIISSIATAASVVIVVITYCVDFHNRKKSETIKAVDQVLNSYYDLPKDRDYHEYVKFMSGIERFAVDANENILIKRLIKKRLSIFLINEYEQNMKEIISQRRKQFNRDSYYDQIDTLIKYLKK